MSGRIRVLVWMLPFDFFTRVCPTLSITRRTEAWDRRHYCTSVVVKSSYTHGTKYHIYFFVIH
ncbi:hypothetical protein Lal_00046753 [Lupinus albus]|nr:hypothetical protein Lal_00046753 [Lupinus albus]